MYKASAGVALPTSIIGSLPRPYWYNAVLGSRSFLEAMVNSRYREQYEDAVCCFLRAQETAGLDICTDGDAHYDEEVGGMSWQGYPLTHMEGFAEQPEPMVYKIGAVAYPRGHILHDFLEARVFPRIVCPVVQMEEPQIHMVPARGKTFGKLDVEDLVKIFNNTVKGLRSKTEVWCHTCWGNPSQQRIFKDVQSYRPTLAALSQVDADALTFETCSSGAGDLEAIGEVIKDKKVVIGVIDHHTLQVERPDDVAALIREALRYIPPERLIISSDCGMGREGMGRRHAAYKMVSMVLGTNIVRRELGLPEAECLAAESRYSLTLTKA